MTLAWRGVFPAATTQFSVDFAVDIAATLRHMDVMIESGVHGLIMLGTVGENCSVEFEEKLEVLKATVGHVRRRVPVLTGVAEYTTATACRFAEAAENVGVDGLMLLPAMVYKSDPRETMAHFRAVASAVDLPIICYNNPVSYGVDITPEMFDELADEIPIGGAAAVVAFEQTWARGLMGAIRDNGGEILADEIVHAEDLIDAGIALGDALFGE